MIYEEICKRIRFDYDKELEAEWLADFIIHAIIKQDTYPLVYINTYKKFNLDIMKEIKKSTSSKFEICYMIFIIIFGNMLLIGLISTFVYYAYSAVNNIPQFILCIIFIVCTLFSMWLSMFVICCEFNKFLIKNKNDYITNKNAYFAV
jgi:hypothetical protein